MDRNALAELLQALESRRDAEERRREERYTALIERFSSSYMAQGNPSSTEEAGSQRGAKAGGEDEVHKGCFPGQAGRMDEMGECGTTQDWLARLMVNGTEQDQFPHQVNI
ncbi:UNVERIFIED_CONTAM: hypothetical protein FKN15_069770 [Acipenser sinensis]